MMPRRKQTREEDRRDRIIQEPRQLRTPTLLKALGLLGRRIERFDAAVRIEIHGSVFAVADRDR